MADKLTLSAQRTARVADRISATFAKQLASIFRGMERRISELLVGEMSSGVQAVASQALAVRNQIRRILEESGYRELIDVATSAALDRMADRVLASRRMAGVAYRLAPEASLLLNAMKTIHFYDMSDEWQAINSHIVRAVSRGVIGGTPVKDILRELAKVMDTSVARVGTLYDTAVSIYGRQVESLAAGDDPETVFLYSGPIDDKTRDFCLERVGQVFTRAEIDEMDNEQIANVFLTGGGYNCRHVWMEVSAFSALQHNVGTGKRVPEVESAIRRVQRRKAA